jgi:hypothetical protein
VAGLAAIWAGVVGISVLAPDLVSGSQQEHLPLAALHSWIWGLVASVGYLWAMSRLRWSPAPRAWAGLTAAVIAIWGAAVIVAMALPVWETGSDPTRLPIGAIASPIGAALLTILAGVVAGIAEGSPTA